MARIFITGSSDGLGLMAGRLLIDQGHEVVLHGRNEGRSRDALAAAAGARGVVERPVSLRGEQAVRCFAGICRRSPLARRHIQRAGTWMGGNKDGRPFSARRSSSGVRHPELACDERG